MILFVDGPLKGDRADVGAASPPPWFEFHCPNEDPVGAFLERGSVIESLTLSVGRYDYLATDVANVSMYVYEGGCE